jgi:negative regulator of flagellin synthesis FlgM
MDINGVSSSKVLKLYNNNNNNSTSVKDTKTKAPANDSLEISNLGKKLSDYSIDDSFNSPKDKINAIKDDISNGTYNRSSKLVAQKIVDCMKGKGV